MFQFANAKGLNLMDTGAKMLFSKMSRDEFETRKHNDDVTGNRSYAALCPYDSWLEWLTMCRESDERPCVTHDPPLR